MLEYQISIVPSCIKTTNTNFSHRISDTVMASTSKEQINAFITTRTKFIEAAYCSSIIMQHHINKDVLNNIFLAERVHLLNFLNRIFVRIKQASCSGNVALFSYIDFTTRILDCDMIL